MEFMIYLNQLEIPCTGCLLVDAVMGNLIVPRAPCPLSQQGSNFTVISSSYPATDASSHVATNALFHQAIMDYGRMNPLTTFQVKAIEGHVAEFNGKHERAERDRMRAAEKKAEEAERDKMWAAEWAERVRMRAAEKKAERAESVRIVKAELTEEVAERKQLMQLVVRERKQNASRRNTKHKRGPSMFEDSAATSKRPITKKKAQLRYYQKCQHDKD
jgi:hypothetical protein